MNHACKMWLFQRQHWCGAQSCSTIENCTVSALVPCMRLLLEKNWRKPAPAAEQVMLNKKCTRLQNWMISLAIERAYSADSTVFWWLCCCRQPRPSWLWTWTWESRSISQSAAGARRPSHSQSVGIFGVEEKQRHKAQPDHPSPETTRECSPSDFRWDIFSGKFQ